MADVEKAVDPFKEQALGVLKSLIEAATQAGDFIKDQIPLVIQELLAFNTAKYVLFVVVSVAALTASVFWIRYCFKRYKAANDHWSEWNLATIPGFVLLPVGAAALVASTVNLLQITLAPRVWLIEYAAALVR
jgi:hypothetical protein